MFEQKDIFERGLVQVIRNLKNYGIDDITTEVVKLENNGKQMKFRFFTEQQWTTNPENKANEATVLFGKTYKGFVYPDHIIKYEDQTYFVKIV